jgi:hypothetical protein
MDARERNVLAGSRLREVIRQRSTRIPQLNRRIRKRKVESWSSEGVRL